MNQNTKALAVAAKAGSIAKAAFPSFARRLFLLALVAFFVLVFFLWLQGAEQSLEVAPQPKAVEAAQAALPDPCGLTDVVCPDEAPTAAVAPQAKPKRVIQATITTYQAVAAQTDATPCVGAMPRVNFCQPPFPIVANNCLALGSKVEIRGREYTVADRMARRFGCDRFDILTSGDNYRLTNEPVNIL